MTSRVFPPARKVIYIPGRTEPDAKSAAQVAATTLLNDDTFKNTFEPNMPKKPLNVVRYLVVQFSGLHGASTLPLKASTV